MSRLLISGFDIVPVPREDSREDGSTTKYELYACRAHLLGAHDGRVTHSTILVGPPRPIGQAMSTLEDQVTSQGALPGSELDMGLIGADPRSFRFWHPDRRDVPGTGVVVGHLAVYHPAERLGRNSISKPQIISMVALHVKKDDGNHSLIHARMFEPGSRILERDKSPAGETFYTWQMLRNAFPMDSEVEFTPKPNHKWGYYQLEGDMEQRMADAERRSIKALLSNRGGFVGARA